MEWTHFAVLLAAAPFILFPAAFIWYVNIGGVCCGMGKARARKKASADMVCSIDKDCPPGFVCMGGHCVPSR